MDVSLVKILRETEQQNLVIRKIQLENATNDLHRAYLEGLIEADEMFNLTCK